MVKATDQDAVRARRAKESARVEERALIVETRAELDAALTLADDKLVIVETYSQEECNLGDNPEIFDSPTWNESIEAKEALFEPCRRLHSTISRVARECDNVVFVLLEVFDKETRSLADEIGVKALPTVQFWKKGEVLYQVNGVTGAGQAIGEGALYYADQGAGGESVAGIVEEIKTKEALQNFVERCDMPGEGARGVELDIPCEKQIAVLDVSKIQDSPVCMRIYPAVVAMAKNMRGAVRWARLMVDQTPETAEIAKDLKVEAVPTFVFFCEGKEIGRISTTDRVQLMQAVLEQQQRFGVKLPTPPPRKRMSTAEAKAIAKAKREKEKKSAW